MLEIEIIELALLVENSWLIGFIISGDMKCEKVFLRKVELEKKKMQKTEPLLY